VVANATFPRTGARKSRIFGLFGRESNSRHCGNHVTVGFPIRATTRALHIQAVGPNAQGKIKHAIPQLLGWCLWKYLSSHRLRGKYRPLIQDAPHRIFPNHYHKNSLDCCLLSNHSTAKQNIAKSSLICLPTGLSSLRCHTFPRQT
jgi:hypothetical protein